MLFKNNISQAKLIDEKWFGIVKNTWGRGGTAEKTGRKEWEIGRGAGELRRNVWLDWKMCK